MKNNTKEKWVWLDLDETLHDFSSAAQLAKSATISMLADGANLPLGRVEEDHQQLFKAHNLLAFADGRSSHEYRNERFREAVKSSLLSPNALDKLVSNAVSEYEHIFMSNLNIKPGTVDMLQSLGNMGYKLAILSEAPRDVPGRVLDKLGLSQFFDAVFTAGGLKRSKPSGMFRLVLDDLAVQPESVTMVGDSLERDIIPALGLGMNAIWFNEKKLPNPHGYKEIHLLEHVPGIIGCPSNAVGRGANYQFNRLEK